MSSSFWTKEREEELRECLQIYLQSSLADYKSLASITHKLYKIERALGVNKLLLEQELLDLCPSIL